MKRLQRLLPAAMSALVLCAQAQPPTPAQPTYRIIGPDGKVTFSDRKPTDSQARTRELGKTVTAPLLAPSPAPFDLHPATSMPPVAQALGGDAPPVDVSGKPFPPGLPEAVLDVLVHQFFVQTLVESCDRLRPTFAERYHGGVRNWRDRNADILAKSNRITFARFTAEQRDVLRATARTRLAQLLPPAEAPPEDKMLWCDRTSTDLARRQFDLVGDMRVAPILYFTID